MLQLIFNIYFFKFGFPNFFLTKRIQIEVIKKMFFGGVPSDSKRMIKSVLSTQSNQRPFLLHFPQIIGCSIFYLSFATSVSAQYHPTAELPANHRVILNFKPILTF